MKNHFHLWECYDTKRISIDLNERLRNKFADLMNKKIYNISKQLKITPSRMYDYFINKDSPIPLDKLLRLSKLLGVNLREIEDGILSYKQKLVPRKNSVFNPILPLKISPYFTSIVSNLFFDGSLPKDGKGAYYNQKRETIMDLFTKRLLKVFGDLQYSVTRDHREVLKCRFPRIVGEICKKIYGVETFLGDRARLSKNILSLDKENKTAFLISAILDEGSIAYDGHIIFGVNNKRLCEDMRNLTRKLDLSVSDLRNKKNSNFYYFHIKSIEKLFKIVTSISKKFPLISLDYKFERLKKSLEIKNQKFEYLPSFANKRIQKLIKKLSKEGKNVNQLSINLLIPPRTIRRYLYKLIDEGKVIRIKEGNQYIYFLKS